MAYELPSQSAVDDAELDQFRINRLGGAQLDYELARIANEHPEWTPDQVRLAQQGKLAGAPSTRLLTGYGLPPRYRITGSDPQAIPPISAVNPRSTGRNSLVDSIARQQNQFRLNQITSAQRQLDKLSPDDEDYDTKKAALESRIDTLNEPSPVNAAPNPEAAVPLGKGTAGEEAPVYQAGGPAAFKRLSNGGSVYFGPAGGAPAFTTQRPQVMQDVPASGTIPAGSASAAPQPIAPTPTASRSIWSLAKAALMGGGDPQATVNNLSDVPPTFEQPTIPPSSFKISPKKLSQYVNLKKSRAALPDDAPDVIKSAADNLLGGFESKLTNSPAFTIAPQSTSYGSTGVSSPAPAQINSQEEYDALPAGSSYVDSNGKLATKKGNQ